MHSNPSRKEFFSSINAAWADMMGGAFYFYWGAMVAFICGILALFFEQKTVSLVFAILGGLGWLTAFVIATYKIWAKECDEVLKLERVLDPQISLFFDPDDEGCMHITNENTSSASWLIRVLPQCVSRVNYCQGYIRQVYKYDGTQWKETKYKEKFVLKWGMVMETGEVFRDISNDVNLYLDIFQIPVVTNKIELRTTTGVIPGRAASEFTIGDKFRIDIGIMGEGQAKANISLYIKTNSIWSKPKVSTQDNV